jgi:hypothetical protein
MKFGLLEAVLLHCKIGSSGDEPSRIGEKDTPAHQDAPSSLVKVNGLACI